MKSTRRIPSAEDDTRSASDIIHDGTSVVRSVAGQLANLAFAFERTGNDRVGEELHGAASALMDHAQAILEAYQNQRVIEAQQGIQNGQRFVSSILKGLLDGKDHKDAAIEAMPHHFSRDLIDKEPHSA